jgi:hypothetical protein
MFYAQCKRKCGHSTRARAEAEAQRATEASGRTMYVYRCPHCSKYHLTKHLGQQVRRGIKRVSQGVEL